MNRVRIICYVARGLAIASIAVLVWVCAPAGAAGPKIWSGVATLPSGGSTSSSEVLSSPTGATFLFYLAAGKPTLARFGANGALGSPVTLPPDPVFGATAAGVGPVAFLPNGDAVMSYAPDQGQFTLVYRFANGTFGPVLKASNMTSFAARAGEVLAAYGGTVQDYSIAADGTIAAKGGPVTLYSGQSLFGESWTALDAGGTADIVINEDDNGPTVGPVEFTRSATGGWSGPRTLGAQTNGVVGATAPGGRAIIAFQQGDGNTTDTKLYYAVRDPGSAYGAPQLVNSLNAAGGALDYDMVAAGGDGTLALAYRAYTCAEPNVDDVPSASITAVVVPPSGNPSSVPIGNSQTTADTVVTLDSVGAGDGQAIVGMDSINSSAYPYGTASCTTMPIPDPLMSTTSDFVAITGGSPATFATSGPSTTPASVHVDSVGLDIAGDAVAMGSLSAGGSDQYATYGTPGSATGTTGPTGPTGPTGSTGPTGPLPPPNAGPISAPTNVNGQGQQSLSITNPNDYSLTATIQESGLVTAAADIARAGRKPKTIAGARTKIAPHKKAKITLKLSKAARNYLKKHHRLKATLTIKLTATGHRSRVVTKRLTLRSRT